MIFTSGETLETIQRGETIVRDKDCFSLTVLAKLEKQWELETVADLEPLVNHGSAGLYKTGWVLI
eukprot:5955840-Amphidinium_carterae.1